MRKLIQAVTLSAALIGCMHSRVEDKVKRCFEEVCNCREHNEDLEPAVNLAIMLRRNGIECEVKYGRFNKNSRKCDSHWVEYWSSEKREWVILDPENRVNLGKSKICKETYISY